MSRLAAMTAASTAASSASPLGATARPFSASVAMRLATSPKPCPPMPSATAHRPDLGAHQQAVLVAGALQADVGGGGGADAADQASALVLAKAPVSMSANSVGGGMPTTASASDSKPSPPTVHQKLWPAKAPRWPNRRAARKASEAWAVEPAHQHDALRQLLDAGDLLDPRLQRSAGQALDRPGEALERHVRRERAEQRRLRRFAPGLVGLDLRRRQQAVALAAEQSQRERPPDAVDRRHQRAEHRLARELRAEPEAPDRRAIIGGRPALAEHLARGGQARLQPRLPHGRGTGATPDRRRSRAWRAACRRTPQA